MRRKYNLTPTNRKVAALGRRALKAAYPHMREDKQTALRDLLQDLMHVAVQDKLDFADALSLAKKDFPVEAAGPVEAWKGR